MQRSIRSCVLRACGAAFVGGFALGAAGQTELNQAQVGLERAVKTPAEIIWLKDEILAELWRRNPLLDTAPGGCSDKRGAKETCTVGNPPAWRYVFGAGPFESRFKPLTSGVYLIAPRANATGLMRAPTGEILLAAGTSVTLIDAAYPGIQIELTAPQDQPLPLGNLAVADAGKVFGLLAKQAGAMSASAASVLENGRVALKSEGNVQVAAATPVPAVARAEIAKPVEVAMLAPPAVPVEPRTVKAAPRPLEFRGTIEVSRFPTGEELKLVAEAQARMVREIVASAQAHREPVAAVVAHAQPLVFTGVVDVRVAAKHEEKPQLDAGPIIAAVAPIPEAAAAPAQPAPAAAAPEPQPKSDPVVRETQRVVAAASPDVAHLRAEVEAEIERDRVRLAKLQQQSCSGIGRPLQGCTIAAPKRVSFAS